MNWAPARSLAVFSRPQVPSESSIGPGPGARRNRQTGARNGGSGARRDRTRLGRRGDLSGAWIPSLRRHVVYHSATTARMEAVLVEKPDAPEVLVDQPALRGMISDRGLLAIVPAEDPGSVCLADVSARLPTP